jgi:hypothetical protein
VPARVGLGFPSPSASAVSVQENAGRTALQPGLSANVPVQVKAGRSALSPGLSTDVPVKENAGWFVLPPGLSADTPEQWIIVTAAGGVTGKDNVVPSWSTGRPSRPMMRLRWLEAVRGCGRLMSCILWLRERRLSKFSLLLRLKSRI